MTVSITLQGKIVNGNKPENTAADWDVTGQWMCFSLYLCASDFFSASQGLIWRLLTEEVLVPPPWTTA